MPTHPTKTIPEPWRGARGTLNAKKVKIIATAGGGIQAAPRTAEVMTQLQQHCENVNSSLVLVSYVSGASGGAMFMLSPYSADDGS